MYIVLLISINVIFKKNTLGWPITVTIRDYVRQRTDRKWVYLKVLLKVLSSLSDVNERIMKIIYTATIQSTLEYGAITFVSDRLQVSHNQGMRLILEVPRGTSTKVMWHELPMIHVKHRAKLLRKIRGNTNHPLHTTINKGQRKGWTIDSQQNNWRNKHTQLQINDIAPWEQLPYECRINWTLERRKILIQRSLAYIRSQPDKNMYYTDGSIDGIWVAAEIVHKEEEIIIRVNDSAFVLDAEMTALRIALEEASGTRYTITIQTD